MSSDGHVCIFVFPLSACLLNLLVLFVAINGLSSLLIFLVVISRVHDYFQCRNANTAVTTTVIWSG